MWFDALCWQLCTGVMCPVETNPGGTGWQLWCGESTDLFITLYCAPFQLFEPKPQGNWLMITTWWINRAVYCALFQLFVGWQLWCGESTVLCTVSAVWAQTPGELVDDYDMVNQQSCVLCTVSAVRGLTVMMWWINRPVYHPVLCTVSAVWAQTPGGAGSQLRRGMRAHEEELSPCRRGRQTHCPSGAWRPRWQLPAWCCRSHGQRWVDNATVGSPWVPAPVEIRVLNKNMSLPKADEVGVLQEWVVISMFG